MAVALTMVGALQHTGLWMGDTVPACMKGVLHDVTHASVLSRPMVQSMNTASQQQPVYSLLSGCTRLACVSVTSAIVLLQSN